MKSCFCGGTTQLSEYCDQFFCNPLLVCNNCGSLLIDRVPVDVELSEFYNGKYSVARQLNVTEAYFEVMRRRANAQTDLIKKHISIKKAKILDYGCGYGTLIDKLSTCGAETYGFDYDPLCRKILSEKGHFIVEQDVFESTQKWDVVCLSHVLEHLSDPVEFLTKIANSSRIIFIEVPKYDVSIREQFVDLEGHLWFFTEQGLTSLVSQSGLCIQNIISVGPDLRLFWSNSWITRCLRDLNRLITKDLFFNSYDKRRKNGMWIRIIATGKII